MAPARLQPRRTQRLLVEERHRCESSEQDAGRWQVLQVQGRRDRGADSNNLHEHVHSNAVDLKHMDGIFFKKYT